jgi:hypothetical protein
MRCLYCGKELALLKRLRGGGDFCSDAHKQSYQEEYNRLALSRLLQAQKKGQQGNNSPVQNTAPPPSASVALEEPAQEEVGSATGEIAADASVLEVTLTQAEPEAVDDPVEVEESPLEAEIESSLGTGPEPTEAAGFLVEIPTLMLPPEEEALYLETWIELSAGPAMSEWQIQNGAFGLSSADLVSLDLRPKASSIEQPAWAGDLSPQAFPSAQPEPPLSPMANARRKIVNTNRLPAGSVIAIDVEPSDVPSQADAGSVEAVGFETTVLFDQSRLLELPPSAIDFATEDSSVVVMARSPYHEASPDLAASESEALVPQQPGAEPTSTDAGEDDGPRASLEALSRLHQELVEQEAARVPEAVPPPAELQAEPVEVPVEVVASVPAESPEAEPEIVETTAEESKPKFATELFDISLKTFPPAKAALIGGDAHPGNTAPLLPHLKSLPLRPKVALATGYVPPAKASALSETKPAPPATTPVRTQAPSKPAAAGKPAARLTQPKQPQPAKPSQSPVAKPAESRAVAAPKTMSPKPDAAKPVANPAPAIHPPVPEAAAAHPDVPEVTQKAPRSEKEQPTKPKPEADIAKPEAEIPKRAVDKPKPLVEQVPPPDNVPHFDIAQPANASWIGSLKMKLGLAIVLLVIACAYFLGWGGKSRKPTVASAGSSDGSGPSIIMGEGGWVEGWAGDPSGVHAGRQITIYRPSLKLSDYRLEFDGSIDTKSVGWVFRASDPDNYYAMKLMLVSSGLSPKIALFKYLVANGKQTQVGRVPIDLPVQADSVFHVRVDVRGPQFTTSIQGQQVDSWTDDQLKTGGAGFLNERDERGKVKSVSIRYLSGAPNKN